MKRIFLTIFTALIAAFPARADLTASIGLASGDKIAIGGDSITAAKLYSHYLAAYLQLTYPALDLKTYTVARSGSSIGGWATPAPVAPGASSTGLYERYHYPLSPDIVFMMHGQNAGETAAAHVAHYADELWPGWVDGVSGAKLVILGMHPVQAATDTKSAAAKADAEAAFAAATAGVYASNTFDYMGTQWLANSGNAIDVQQSGVEPSTGTRDTVHPGPAGNVVIAWAVLQGLGETGFVSSATLNAATNTTTAATDCTISNLALTSTGGTFDRLDARLPWAIDESGRDNAVALIPAIAGWQDYSITITGLAAGSYDIKCDGVVIGEATATELAAGWNMADLTAGPVWEQAQEVLGECRDLEGVDRTTVAWIVPSPTGTLSKYQDQSLASYQTGNQRGSTYFATMAPLVAAMDTNLAELQADAQPVTRTYTITAQNAWSYPGIPYTDWAYDPFTMAAPATPAEWPSAEHAGYYFVDKDNPAATNTVDGSDTTDASGRRYGYPARPRLTLPTSSSAANTYPAGTVVWIKGGTWDTGYSTSADWAANFQGTSGAPCWIYGDPSDRPSFGNLRILISDTEYLFAENIDWRYNAASSNTGFQVGSNGVAGDCAYIMLRNCSFEDRELVGTNPGAMISISAPLSGVTGVEVHDVAVYNCTFSNNGLNADYSDPMDDYDYHGIKLNGLYGVNRTSRIWVINNTATLGAGTQPDGFRRSIAGTFIQVGDQTYTQGGIDHFYIAGNNLDGVLQGGIGIKRAGPGVISSNIITNVPDAAQTSGGAIGLKYDRRGQSEGANTGEGIWFINNLVDGAKSGINNGSYSQGTGNDTHVHADGRVYIIGNVFRNLNVGTFNGDDTSSSLGAWKRRAGVAMDDRDGKTYIINNTVDSAGYGVVTAGNSRDYTGAEVHIYNNIWAQLGHASDPIDGSGVAVFQNGNPGTTAYFIEDNLHDVFAARYTGTTYSSLATYNARSDVAGYLEGSPLFTNSAGGDYSLTASSPARDAGVSTTSIGSVNVLTLFTVAFAGDADFPGDPSDVWPRDYLGAARVQGSAIDIGAYEYAGASSAGGSITTGILNIGTLNIGTP